MAWYVFGTGHVARDPQFRVLPSGVATARFRVGSDRDYLTDGKRESDFLDVVAWRGQAEYVENRLSVGDLVQVTGDLRYRTYVQDGTTRGVWECHASQIRKLRSSRASERARFLEDLTAALEQNALFRPLMPLFKSIVGTLLQVNHGGEAASSPEPESAGDRVATEAPAAATAAAAGFSDPIND